MTIEIQGLRMSYGDATVLDIPRLELDFPHCVAFIGPSGGGKSTLLRILSGLEIPDCGDVRINGRRLQWNERALADYRKGVGVVFQAFNLFPHLTALENILLPLEKVHGETRAAARDRAMELLTRFGLAAHTAKKPAALSGGQRQRVAIARAAATRPACLFLDEPTSALDPEMTAEVLQLIEDLRGNERPLVLVTHEIAFARHAADEIVFLHNGGIAARGPAQTFFTRSGSDIVDAFLEKTLRFTDGAS